MITIGLLVATMWEVPDVIPHSRPGYAGVYKVGNYDVGVVISGVGQKNAHGATMRICEKYNPDYLLSLGICGGAQRTFAIGTILVADSVHYNHHEIALESHPLNYMKQFLSDNFVDYQIGKFQTFDHAVLSKKEVVKDAIGVDMESHAIAQVARRYAVPLVVVKVVSDIIPEKTSPLLPKLRLYYHIIKNFRVAKKTLNTFSYEYFNCRH